MNADGRRSRGINTAFRFIALATAVLLAAVFAAGCSSSKKKSTPSSSSSAATAGAAEAEIRSVFTSFADVSIPVEQKVNQIQDGAEFVPVMQSLAALDTAKDVSVTVSKVVINSANKATVTYSILIKGSPILPNQTGYAIHEDGTWKVAGVTFCGLILAQGQNPPVCSKPAATSLPS